MYFKQKVVLQLELLFNDKRTFHQEDIFILNQHYLVASFKK